VDRGWRAFVAGPAGDLDGDGRTDLAVAAFPNRGLAAFEIVTAADAPVVRWRWERSRHPSAVVPFPDADGDGTSDLLVGDGFRGDERGRDFTGEVRLVSGKDGTTLRVVKGANSSDALGTSVAATRDLDGDRFPDFVAGATGVGRGGKHPSVGAVRAYSGKTGKLLWSAKGDKGRLGLGLAVCALGDMDGDGVDDVAAGSEEVTLEGEVGTVLKGYVVVLSGRTGKEIRRYEE
jgi:hypothetical protein